MIIIILCLLIIIYFIYKLDIWYNSWIHDNYLKCHDELEKITEEYVNGLYGFEIYSRKKKELFEKYHIPLDYKEDSM